MGYFKNGKKLFIMGIIQIRSVTFCTYTGKRSARNHRVYSGIEYPLADRTVSQWIIKYIAHQGVAAKNQDGNAHENHDDNPKHTLFHWYHLK